MRRLLVAAACLLFVGCAAPQLTSVPTPPDATAPAPSAQGQPLGIQDNDTVAHGTPVTTPPLYVPPAGDLSTATPLAPPTGYNGDMNSITPSQPGDKPWCQMNSYPHPVCDNTPH